MHEVWIEDDAMYLVDEKRAGSIATCWSAHPLAQRHADQCGRIADGRQDQTGLSGFPPALLFRGAFVWQRSPFDSATGDVLAGRVDRGFGGPPHRSDAVDLQ